MTKLISKEIMAEFKDYPQSLRKESRFQNF